MAVDTEPKGLHFKIGRRGFLKLGSVLGIGTAVAGVGFSVNGLVELATQPTFDPNWKNKLAQYPENYTRDEILIAKNYVKQYEAARTILEREGKLEEIHGLADGATLVNSHRIIMEGEKHMGSLIGLNKDWQREMSELADRSMIKTFGGVMAMMFGLSIWSLTQDPNVLNNHDQNRQ